MVVIGGGLHGCEIAEFLVKRGRKVTIVEQDNQIGTEVLDFRLGLTMDWFEKRGVTIITSVKEIEIVSQGLKLTNGEGIDQIIQADTIIPTRPLVSNLGLFEELQGKVSECYAIGDCSEPGKIVNAIADAHETARNI